MSMVLLDTDVMIEIQRGRERMAGWLESLARRAALYTFNLRHYQTIPGLNARTPYPRDAS